MECRLGDRLSLHGYATLRRTLAREVWSVALPPPRGLFIDALLAKSCDLHMLFRQLVYSMNYDKSDRMSHNLSSSPMLVSLWRWRRYMVSSGRQRPHQS